MIPGVPFSFDVLPRNVFNDIAPENFAIFFQKFPLAALRNRISPSEEVTR